MTADAAPQDGDQSQSQAGKKICEFPQCNGGGESTFHFYYRQRSKDRKVVREGCSKPPQCHTHAQGPLVAFLHSALTEHLLCAVGLWARYCL